MNVHLYISLLLGVLPELREMTWGSETGRSGPGPLRCTAWPSPPRCWRCIWAAPRPPGPLCGRAGASGPRKAWWPHPEQTVFFWIQEKSWNFEACGDQIIIKLAQILQKLWMARRKAKKYRVGILRFKMWQKNRIFSAHRKYISNL